MAGRRTVVEFAVLPRLPWRPCPVRFERIPWDDWDEQDSIDEANAWRHFEADEKVKTCIQCQKDSIRNGWAPGEVCLFGELFACSVACAERWARENAREGCRPGEPGFRIEMPHDSDAIDPDP